MSARGKCQQEEEEEEGEEKGENKRELICKGCGERTKKLRVSLCVGVCAYRCVQV